MVGRHAALVLGWPTAWQSPPPPTADRMPPPPSPPPALLLEFNQTHQSTAFFSGAVRGLLVLQRDAVYGLLAGLEPGETHRLAIPCGAGAYSEAFRADAQGVAEVSVRFQTAAWPLDSVAVVTNADELGCEPARTNNFTQFALVGRFPAYAGSLEVRGLLAATRSPTSLAITGLVFGLEPSEQGMWHLHKGFNCDGGSRRLQDAPEVYLGVQWGYWLGAARSRGLEPWATTRWRSDGAGVALIREEFRLERPDEYAPLARSTGARVLPSFEGRAVVVHAPDGAYAACGTLGPEGATALLAEVVPHPHAPIVASGATLLARLEQRSSGQLALRAAASGLVPGARARWSVRRGFICPDYHDKLGRLVPLDVGTAYAPGLGGEMEADSDGLAWTAWDQPSPSPSPSSSPAAATAAAAAAAAAAVSLGELRGRVLLLSDAAGAPLACGPLEPSRALVAELNGGLVVAAPAECGVAVRVAGARHGATLTLSGASSGAASDAAMQLRAGPRGELGAELLGYGLEQLRGRIVTVDGLPGGAPLNGPPAEVPHVTGAEACAEGGASGLPVAFAVVGGAAALLLAGVCLVLHLPRLRGRPSPSRFASQVGQRLSRRLASLSSSGSGLGGFSPRSRSSSRTPDSRATLPLSSELPRGDFVRQALRRLVPRGPPTASCLSVRLTATPFTTCYKASASLPSLIASRARSLPRLTPRSISWKESSVGRTHRSCTRPTTVPTRLQRTARCARNRPICPPAARRSRHGSAVGASAP